jgi:iron complex outermembrane receptor protein
MQNNYSNRGAIELAIGFDPSQAVRNADGTFFNGTLLLLKLIN